MVLCHTYNILCVCVTIYLSFCFPQTSVCLRTTPCCLRIELGWSKLPSMEAEVILNNTCIWHSSFVIWAWCLLREAWRSCIPCWTWFLKDSKELMWLFCFWILWDRSDNTVLCFWICLSLRWLFSLRALVVFARLESSFLVFFCKLLVHDLRECRLCSVVYLNAHSSREILSNCRRVYVIWNVVVFSICWNLLN